MTSSVVLFIFLLVHHDDKCHDTEAINTFSNSHFEGFCAFELTEGSLSDVSDGLSALVVDLHSKLAGTSFACGSHRLAFFVTFVKPVVEYHHAGAAALFDVCETIQRFSIFFIGTLLSSLVGLKLK